MLIIEEQEKKIISACKQNKKFAKTPFLKDYKSLLIEESPFLKGKGIKDDGLLLAPTANKISKGTLIGAYLFARISQAELKRVYGQLYPDLNITISDLNLENLRYSMPGDPKQMLDDDHPDLIIGVPTLDAFNAAKEKKICPAYFINHCDNALVHLERHPDCYSKNELKGLLKGTEGYLLYDEEIFAVVNSHCVSLTEGLSKAILEKKRPEIMAIFPKEFGRIKTPYIGELKLLERFNSNKPHPKGHNIEFDWEECPPGSKKYQLIFRAVRDILPGEELLTSYGEYFQNAIGNGLLKKEGLPGAGFPLLDVEYDFCTQLALKIEGLGRSNDIRDSLTENKPQKLEEGDFLVEEQIDFDHWSDFSSIECEYSFNEFKPLDAEPTNAIQNLAQDQERVASDFNLDFFAGLRTGFNHCKTKYNSSEKVDLKQNTLDINLPDSEFKKGIQDILKNSIEAQKIKFILSRPLIYQKLISMYKNDSILCHNLQLTSSNFYAFKTKCKPGVKELEALDQGSAFVNRFNYLNVKEKINFLQNNTEKYFEMLAHYGSDEEVRKAIKLNLKDFAKVKRREKMDIDDPNKPSKKLQKTLLTGVSLHGLFKESTVLQIQTVLGGEAIWLQTNMEI